MHHPNTWRRVLFVIFASGLKYIGVGTTALGWTLCAVLLLGGLMWVQLAKPWRPRREEEAAVRDQA